MGESRSESVRKAFDQNAKVYADKFHDQSAYLPAVARFADGLNKHPKIVELGCGPGNLSRLVVDKCQPSSYSGVDLAPNMIELFKARFPNFEGSVSSIQAYTLPEKFDAIVLGFCLPYLNPEEVQDLFKRVFAGLTNNGKVYLSWILGDNHSKLSTSSDGEHQLMMYYYSHGFITDIQEKYGFELEYQEIINEDVVLVWRKN